jgi:hypothetical protein
MPPPLAGVDAPFLTGEYKARVVNQTIDGVVKEVPIKDALSNLMSVCTDEKRAGMVEKKIAALSAKGPYPMIKEFQDFFTQPVPARKDVAPTSFTNWDSFATFANPAKPHPPAAPVAAAVALPPISGIVGSEPFRRLSADLRQRCLTLEGLNAYIAALYPADQDSYKVRNGWNDLKRGVRGCNNKDIIGEWQNVFSSPNNHDCLIHSFLTATCDAFRKLTDDHKDTVASNFRRIFLPTTEAARAMRQDLQSELVRMPAVRDAYLANDHISLLSGIYHADILVLEAGGGTFFEENRSRRVFIILNPGTGHYESVRPKRGGNADFSVSREEAQRAFQCISSDRIAAGQALIGVTQTICLPVGTPVLYRGQQYVILDSEVDIVDDPTNPHLSERRCRGYYLATPRGLAEFTDLPNSVNRGGKRLRKEDKAVRQGYLSFPHLILAGEVQAVSAVAAAASPPAANNGTNTVNPLNFADDRNGYIGIMKSLPTAHDLRKNGISEEDLTALFASEWNSAWGAAGGARKRARRARRTAKRRSLRAKRRHTSKGHGGRRKH